VVAGIFGIFSGFWWSYAALVLGLAHKWYAIPAADANKVVGVFLLCWTLLIAVLTIATLRLPSAFTMLLGLVTLALALVTICTLHPAPCTLHPQTTLVKTGGVVVLVFAALGAYLFLSASAAALGGAWGRGYALGRRFSADPPQRTTARPARTRPGRVHLFLPTAIPLVRAQ